MATPSWVLPCMWTWSKTSRLPVLMRSRSWLNSRTPQGQVRCTLCSGSTVLLSPNGIATTSHSCPVPNTVYSSQTFQDTSSPLTTWAPSSKDFITAVSVQETWHHLSWWYLCSKDCRFVSIVMKPKLRMLGYSWSLSINNWKNWI